MLGFSQGAILTHLVCALRERCGPGETLLTEPGNRVFPSKCLQSLKFAILVSGFPSRADCDKILVESSAAGIRLPSLHVWGTSDAMVKPEWSEALLQLFSVETRKIYVHPGGHVVPQRRSDRDSVVEFVKS